MSEVKKQTYSVKEAARVLGLGLNKTYELIQEGVIPVLKLGRVKRIPKKALDRMAAGE